MQITTVYDISRIANVLDNLNKCTKEFMKNKNQNGGIFMNYDL